MAQNLCCTDFVVPAIRAIRPNLKSKPEIVSGVALRRLYRLARIEGYNEPEFRESLQALLEREVVILTARICIIASEDVHSRCTLQRVKSIPPGAFLLGKWWYIDESGQSVTDRKRTTHKVYRSMLLYIASDGLPTYVKKYMIEEFEIGPKQT